MKILHRVPDSVLWLMPFGPPEAEYNLKATAELYGVSPQRLIFTQPLPYKLHLRQKSSARLVLDTPLYNGHKSTADALWAGLPVLTLRQSPDAQHRPVSMVSGSLIHGLGSTRLLKELVVEDLVTYEEQAVRLATDQQLYTDIRDELWARRSAPGGLFDVYSWTLNFEKGAIYFPVPYPHLLMCLFIDFCVCLCVCYYV